MILIYSVNCASSYVISPFHCHSVTKLPFLTSSPPHSLPSLVPSNPPSFPPPSLLSSRYSFLLPFSSLLSPSLFFLSPLTPFLPLPPLLFSLTSSPSVPLPLFLSLSLSLSLSLFLSLSLSFPLYRDDPFDGESKVARLLHTLVAMPKSMQTR